MLIHSFAHAFTMLTMLTMLTWRSARRAKVPPAKSTSAASAAMRGLIHRRAAHHHGKGAKKPCPQKLTPRSLQIAAARAPPYE